MFWVVHGLPGVWNRISEIIFPEMYAKLGK